MEINYRNVEAAWYELSPGEQCIEALNRSPLFMAYAAHTLSMEWQQTRDDSLTPSKLDKLYTL